jgi:WD40 repeat protein/DNA-binding XRE family transcriptional regulator
MDKKQIVPHPLRMERELRGWSRNYVAEQLEVDVVTVGRWERGERFPHPYHRQKLCELFEKKVQELGLHPETSNTSDSQDVVLDRPLQAPNPLRQASDSSFSASDTPDQPIQESSKNEQSKSIFSPFRRHRRIFLMGLAGLSMIVLAGSRWEATSRSSPQLIIQRKPLYQLIDPNSHNWVNHIAYSPDGSALAVAGGNNLNTVWNLQERTIVSYYPTMNRWINDISWSKDNFLATANGSFSDGSIQIWHFPEQKPLFTLQRIYSMWTVSWSPKGDHIAFAGHGTTVEVWNPFTAQPVSHYTYAAPNLPGINRVKWSFDARYLASADESSTVHVWEVTTGKLITCYRGHQSRVMDIAWCPGEYRIASASTDQTAQVWDALSGRCIVTYARHKDEIHGIDWSPNKKYLASGSYDNTVQVWEALTGRPIITYVGPDPHVLTVCWSANGKLLTSGSQEKGIEVWQGPQ